MFVNLILKPTVTNPFLKLAKNIGTISKASKIGIVGCGNVGNAVAKNLLKKGFPVVGMFDTYSHKMDDMPKEIKKCSSPREVAEISDVCITGLPKPGNVMEAAEGSQGILEGLSEGKIWIDHSTTDFEQTLDFSKKAKSRGAHVLEAPITGGLLALQKGQMVVHIGGQKEILDSVKPILEASYKEIFFVGDIGSAMIVKVVSNMLATINAVAAGEVLLLAKKANIDLKTFFDAIRVSAGNSFAWETCVPLILNGKYDPGFTMELLCKDLQLGYDLGRKFRVPLNLNQLTLAISRSAQYKYGDSTGCYSQPKLYEDTTGESLRHPSFGKWSYENDLIEGSIVVRHKNEE
ncbi:UNVERIFIED_CONTAM: hypothetical protein RMT77_012828 [Armadillidium vulgare]